MYYNWKDVRNDAFISLGVGIVATFIAFVITKAALSGTSLSYDEFGLYGIVMFWIGSISLFQLFCWTTGVLVQTHGWGKKTADLVLSNIAFTTPFVVALLI